MTKCARSNGPALGILTGLAVLLLGVVPARAESTPVTECGQVLSTPGQYHLTGNLGPCPRDGVVINASGVTLTLAGFTISGTARTDGCDFGDPEFGVRVVQDPDRPLSLLLSSVRINGGTVTGFTFGILLAASRSRVHAMTIADTCFFGIYSGGSGNVIDTNVMTGNGYFGFWDGIVTASGNTVHSNNISGNAGCGVDLSSTDSNTIRDNIIRNNDGGICSFGSGGDNVIRGNDASRNIDGISVSGTGNVVRDNTAHANANAGIVLRDGSSANTIVGNITRSNGQADLADGNAGCDANAWKRNVFATDLVGGVPDGGPGTGCIQ